MLKKLWVWLFGEELLEPDGDVFTMGADAYHLGKREIDCPWPSESSYPYGGYRRAWQDGYRKARREQDPNSDRFPDKTAMNIQEFYTVRDKALNYPLDDKAWYEEKLPEPPVERVY